jgi:DNA polymerase-3 subunit delta'
MAFSIEQTLDYLTKAHRHGRLAHAFLFSGPQGSGKRRLVEQFFNVINGDTTDQLDLHQIEPESKSCRIVVNQVRELESALRMRSNRAFTKFGVVHDADRLMPQAANAFLKTLEEPPAHSLLVLVTALPGALLDTVLSRCIHVQLRPSANRKLIAEEANLLVTVAAVIEKEGFSVVSALKIAGVFQEALNTIRKRIEAEHDDLLKKDQATYKQATDGTWLEQREERLGVLTESRYVRSRANLVLKIIEWFGDAIRLQKSSSMLDLPEYHGSSSRLGEHSTTADLVNRIGGLQALIGYFSKNIQERVAIEVAFLRVFGPGK